MKKSKTINKTSRRNYGTYIMVLAAFILFYVMQATKTISSSLAGQLVPICAYVVMAISLNLTVGIMGDLSLGHAGFMSVGAFSGIVASTALINAVPNVYVRFFLCMLIGGIFAGLVGLIVVVPVLRLRGDYLAIVTLAFGEIIKNVITCLYVGVDGKGVHFSMTNVAALNLQEGGVAILQGPMGATGVTKISNFIMGFALVMLALLFAQNFINSRSGRAVMALRDNRIAAESVGISINKYKVMAFVSSAVLAGMAGTLYGLNYSTIVPSKFNFNTSILVLVFVVLGGIGNIRGSVIAAFALTVLPELLRGFSDYRMLVYAIVLIVVMLATNNQKVKNLTEKLAIKLHLRKGEDDNGEADTCTE